MHLVTFVVISLTVGAKPCFAGLTVESYTPDRSKLVEASIDILESCYIDRFNTVGFAGPSIANIIERIWSRDIVIPVKIIDETSTAEHHNPFDRASRHKLQVFMIAVTDSRKLSNTLGRVKISKWWNHMASFLLIDSSEVNSGCSKASKILWTAWKMNLINSKFMCNHRTRGTLIYTFNPYTRKAPAPWKLEYIHKGMDDHVWTLFTWEYRGNESRCGALDFDKTLDLGGYKIRAGVWGRNWWDDNITNELETSDQLTKVTARILMDSLNANWKILSRPENDTGNQTINFSIMAHQTFMGKYDILLSEININNSPVIGTTYPHIALSLAILTQYRGNKSQLEKLTSVLDMSSRCGVIIVITITILFFKFYLRKPMILALLDLVLITANSSLSKISKKLGARIYLGCLFMFVVTIQGIYQSQLASLLTSDVHQKNINSIEDLAQSDLTVYSGMNFRNIFNDSAFKGRYIVARTANDCNEHVLRNSKAACFAVKINLIGVAARYNLHLSDKSIGAIDAAYIVRPDWPLEERVNAIHQKIFASGIVDHLCATIFQNQIRSLESHEYRYQHQGVKIMTLETLSFALVLLAIGLGCATVTFIIELVIFGTAIVEDAKIDSKTD